MKIVDSSWVRLLNYISLYAGFLSSYGLFIAGSFQVTRMLVSLNIYNSCFKEYDRTIQYPFCWCSFNIWHGHILLLCCHGDQLAHDNNEGTEDDVVDNEIIIMLLFDWWDYYM